LPDREALDRPEPIGPQPVASCGGTKCQSATSHMLQH